MRTMPSDESSQSEDDLATEYILDYRKAKPNRFAAANQEEKTRVIVLDEDVAQVFSTSEAVNKVLRALK